MTLTANEGALLVASLAWAQGQKGDLVFTPETVEKSGPASKTLQKALKLYESNDFYSASIELHKVIEGETGDSEANKQRGEFWMGKTLYHLHFYSASLSYFDRIVQNFAYPRNHSKRLSDPCRIESLTEGEVKDGDGWLSERMGRLRQRCSVIIWHQRGNILLRLRHPTSSQRC